MGVKMKVGDLVITPKGIAEVYSITIDYGVNTSLGNFCETELELDINWRMLYYQKDKELKELKKKIGELI